MSASVSRLRSSRSGPISESNREDGGAASSAPPPSVDNGTAFWISCRFCTLTIPATALGVSQVIDHEIESHPQEWSQNKQSNYYKIFKLHDLRIDARPTHPLLKTILKLNQFMSKVKRPRKEGEIVSAPKQEGSEVITTDSKGEDEDQRQVQIVSASSSSDGTAALQAIPSPVPTLSSYTAPDPAAARDDRTCAYCHRVFKFPSVLRIHLNSCAVYSSLQRSQHTDGRGDASSDPSVVSHTCSVCSKYFIDAGNLRKHMLLHRGRQRGLSCPYCIKQFRNSILLDQHMDSCHDKERPYNCIHCTEKFTTQTECNLHVCQTHSAAMEPLSGSDPGVEPAPVRRTAASSSLICELCSTACLNRMELISHRAIVHRISAQPLSSNSTSDNIQELVNAEPPDTVPASESEFKCPYCSASFSTWKRIVIHVKTHRSRCNSSKAERFPCRFCVTQLSTPAKVVSHERKMHPKERLRVRAEQQQDKDLRACEALAAAQSQALQPPGINSDGSTLKLESKCRFCPLWFSDRPKRAIHERRSHTDELGSIMLKRAEVIERESLENPNSPAPVISIVPPERLLVGQQVQSVPTPVITRRGSQEGQNDDTRILAEEVHVEVKPDCLNEYLDESGSGVGVIPALAKVPSSSASAAPQSHVQRRASGQQIAETSLTHLLSPAIPVPLKTSAPPTRPHMEVDPLGSAVPIGSFWCQFCGQDFDEFQPLTMHLDSHNYCALCEKKFATSPRYRQHLLSDHDRLRRLFCQTCCAAFEDLHAYCKHSLEMHGIRTDPLGVSAPTWAVSGGAPTTSSYQQQQATVTAPASSQSTTVPVPSRGGGGTALHPRLPLIGSVRVTASYTCSTCAQSFPDGSSLHVHYVNNHTEAGLTSVQRAPVPHSQTQSLAARGMAPAQAQPQLHQQQQTPVPPPSHQYHNLPQQQRQYQQAAIPPAAGAAAGETVYYRGTPPAYQAPAQAPVHNYPSTSHIQNPNPTLALVARPATSTEGGLSSFICDLCGLREFSAASLFSHKIYKHGYTAADTVNQMINSRVIAASTASLSAPSYEQQHQPQPQYQYQQQTQAPLQQQPTSAPISEGIEITNVRVVTRNPNSNQYQQGASFGAGGDGLILQEFLQPQQQIANAPTRSQLQVAQPSSVYQQLQRFVLSKQVQQRQRVQQHAPAIQAAVAVPSTSTSVGLCGGSVISTRDPMNQCTYCQNWFNSRQELIEHCKLVHKMYFWQYSSAGTSKQ